MKQLYDPQLAGYNSTDAMLDAFNEFKSLVSGYTNIKTPVSFKDWYQSAADLYKQNNVVDSPDQRPVEL